MARSSLSKAGPPAKQADIIDVTMPGVSPDELDAADAGRSILTWFGGLAGFFTTAREMEREAQERLTATKALTVPTTKEEDERMQRRVLQTQEQLAGVEAHWNITTQVHRLHRRMTAARSRTTDALTDAKAIENRLHSTYVEAEKRRARDEEDRINRAREQRARDEREAELRRAEEDAARREAEAPELSERETEFVRLYTSLSGSTAGNAAYSAQLAGYKNPDTVGQQLLVRQKIAKAIEVKREAERIRQQAAARREEPIHVERVEVKPEVSRAAGGHDRTTYSLEILDENAFRKAAFAGQLGIPLECFTVDKAECNRQARELREIVNRWPGVRLKTNTGVV